MRKQVKQYLRRSLCGVLSAAMILTGSAISGMTAYAAQPDVENEGGGLAEGADVSTDVAPSEGDKDKVQNPGEGDNAVADDANGTGSDDSKQEGSDGQKQPGDDMTLPGDGEGSGSSDESGDTEDPGTGDAGNGDLSDPNASDEDVADSDAEDKEDEDDSKPAIKKDDESLMAVKSVRDGYGELVNGGFEDFEEVSTGLWAPSTWKFTPDFTGTNKGGFETQTVDTEHGQNSLYIYKETETAISVSQVISNMKPGAYLVALDAGGVYGKDQITLKVESVAQTDENDNDYSTVLQTLVDGQSLGKCDAWGKWNTIQTEPFQVTIPDGKTEVNVKITISGKIGVGGKAEQIHLDDVDFVTYKLTDLNTLLTEAGTKQETDYTAETWATFAEKKSAAQNLVSGGATDETKALEIMQAYIALKGAMDALQSSSTDAKVTLYYYAGETEDEIGLFYWGNNVSTTAGKTEGWKPYDSESNTAYLFTAVDGYAGWYSIPITIKNSGANSGFEIFVSSSTGAPKVKYSNDASSNADIYTNLAKGINKACAYKDGINYSGTDETTGLDKAAAIMRNVTLYVYSEEVVPAIQLANELAAVNQDGSIANLENPGTADSGNVYELQAVADHANWYSLAFSAPGPIALDGTTIFKLYYKTDTGYTWAKDLKNGSTGDTWGVGFAPVFAGENYCKYEHGETDDARKLSFYSSMEDAEGTITLGKLNELLKSEELKAITDKGEAGYTAGTWKTFSEALKAAQDTAASNNTQPETYTSDAIVTAYNSLQDAMKALVPSAADVTLYYYVGDTEEEIGLYCWDNSTDKTNLTSTAQKADWHVRNAGDTYLMTKADGYAGWYSIPVSFKNGGADAGFEIYTKTAAAETDKKPLFKCDAGTANNPEIYAKLASGKNKELAVKAGKGYANDGTTDMVTAIMRQITLHVYDSAGTPSIAVKEGGLSYLDSEGQLKEYKPSATETWANRYDFTEDTEGKNWYSLTFVVPEQFTSGGKTENVQLYSKSGNEYKWVNNFSGTTDSSAVDISPVFSGRIFYKDGVFYKAMEEAEAVTLGQLRAFLASEELKKVTDKGEAGYTKETWPAFDTALTAAKKVVSDNSEQPETYTSDAITTAYINLQSAIKALVSLGADVTLYYYAGKTEDEIGLYYWDNSEGKTNLASTAKKAGWNVWGEGDTYLMAKVDGYAGWYSIPLTFMNGGAEAGFQIFTKTAAAETDTTKKIPLFKCAVGEGNNPEIYAKLASGVKDDTFAIKNGIGYEGTANTAYIMRNVTLYMYDKEKIPYLQVGSGSSISAVDEETGEIKPLTEEAVDGGKGYAFLPCENRAGWYSLTFSVPGSLVFDSGKVCGLYGKGAESNSWAADLLNGQIPASVTWNAIDITPVFSGLAYYKDGIFYATLEEADAVGKITLEQLQKLVDEAKKLKQEDYRKGWETFQKALSAAEAVLQAAADAKTDPTKTAPTDEEIEKAYNELKKAIDDLVSKDAVDADVNVSKIALTDDFITGADLSSYYSLKESGTVFKDDEGKPLSDAAFFQYLHDGGTNWVRIRIWNNPYDGSGRGYGGGNNDLEKAKVMGKLASDAGMKVLIDFHYSDFWADPAKQQAPKAWKALSLAEKEAAVESYTLESLNALRAAGVNVGMVQVGNETNNAICGENSRENMAKIFNAGSKAVRAFDPNCLVALHFTNPEKGGYYKGWAASLKEYNVDYDVFASSYYPFWHGTTSNLEGVLTEVARDYGKKVMVAETSWTTSWEDGDGHENTAPRTTQDLDYDISLQGQADEIRDVINAVNNVNNSQPGKAIGVFYWEPAWISPYYVYDEDGNADVSLVKQNQAAWEQYGSGWAASYAAEYDPDDAGKWYGGSAVDNQSWFDFDGTALATAKIYSLIRTGAVAERAISSIGFAKEQNPLEVPLGTEITYPRAVATYNDGTTEELEVIWDREETQLVNTDKVGEYVVHGTVTESGREYKLTLAIKVMRTSFSNILVNPGFEQDGPAHTGWEVTGKGISANDKDWRENVRSGVYAMHFWSETATTLGTHQIVRPEAGTYTFGAYIQGDGADTEDLHYAYAEVYDKENHLKFRKQVSFTLNGWMNWSEPEVSDITITEEMAQEECYLKVGVEINASAVGTSGIWGTMDDFYLCGAHDVTISDGIEHGSVETSVVRANSGEKVAVTVTPEEGYYLDTMILSGRSITADNCANILASANGTVAFRAAAEGTTNAAVLTYAAETAEAKTDTFTMPNGNVVVSATFKSVFGGMAEKIDLSAKDAAGKYLVQVKAEGGADPAGESPVPAQFHTGKSVTPAMELSYKGYKLATADYQIKYENNKNITTADSKAKITLTAKGDKFTGTREILFEIKEDTRKEFSAKKLKVVFNSSDKNGKTDQAAQAVYYLGKEKEIEPAVSLYNIADDITDATKAIPSDLYQVYYQNNRKIGKATLVVLPTDKALNDPNGYREGSITANFTIAKCPVNQNNVKVAIVSAANYYTGKKVEPSVNVTYEYTEQNGSKKTVILAKGTDYTVTCTNNVNANVYKTADGTYELINPNKVSTLKITGKGNFTGIRSTEDLVEPNNKPGTKKFTFTIRPRDLGGLGEEAIAAEDLAEKTSAQALKITVKDGTKKLAASQYEITEIKRIKDAEGNAFAADKVETIYSKAGGTGTAKVKDAGTYEVKIAGKAKSNYEGEVTRSFRVVDKDHLISNAKITVKGKFYYTGDPIRLATTGDTPNLKVTIGSGAKATLTERGSKDSADDGYYVEYMDRSNINAGKAVIRITGTGKYAGTKNAMFTINKRTLAQSTVSGNAVSGNEKKSAFAYVKLSKKNIEAKQDGTWTPSEANGGLLINTDTAGKTEYGSLAIPYTGYTLSPELKFNFRNCDTEKVKELPGSDYTVTYTIGKWTEGRAPVTATVKGKGNYSGSVKIPNLFTVTARDLRNFSIDVSPVTYNGKALKPTVTFRDKTTGKIVGLKLNTAYSVSYKNNKDIMGVSKKQPTLTVKVKGKGWITDDGDPAAKSRELNFTIDQAEIIRTDVGDIVFQAFKGKELKPKVTIKVNGRKLKEGKDYELTYDKNIKRSGTNTATVSIRGKGNYFTRKPIEKIFVIK